MCALPFILQPHPLTYTHTYRVFAVDDLCMVLLKQRESGELMFSHAARGPDSKIKIRFCSNSNLNVNNVFQSLVSVFTSFTHEDYTHIIQKPYKIWSLILNSATQQSKRVVLKK